MEYQGKHSQNLTDNRLALVLSSEDVEEENYEVFHIGMMEHLNNLTVVCFSRWSRRVCLLKVMRTSVNTKQMFSL